MLPKDNHYIRYINDILIISLPQWNIPSIIYRLSQIEPRLNFTYELEKTTTIPYLFWIYCWRSRDEKLDEPDMQDTAGEAEMNS